MFIFIGFMVLWEWVRKNCVSLILTLTHTDTHTHETHTHDAHTLTRGLQEQSASPQWGQYAQRLADPAGDRYQAPGDGGHNDNAHPPIHPVKVRERGERRREEERGRGRGEESQLLCIVL